MPSAGLLVTALTVPLLASLFYSSSFPGLQADLRALVNKASGSMATSATQQLHVAPHEVHQPAFLAVSADPGELATEEEFNEWYDFEHVPLRMGHIPDFLTGARYQAIDGKKPRYNAVYDIEDFQLFSQTRYTALRANRSPREADLVKRFEILDRRTGKVLLDTGRKDNSAKAAALYSTTLYIEPVEGKDEEMQAWLKGEALSAYKSIAGWKRTSAHHIVDSLLTGAGFAPKANTAAKYMVFNEWATEDAAKQSENIATFETVQEIAKGQESRLWSLYRAWDNTAKQPLNRLAPSYPPPGTSEVGDKIRVRRGKRGLTALDGALLNAPEMANGWNAHVGAVRNKNSLPGDVRELIILRVAARNGAAYEWIHHEHVGRSEGLTTAQLAWLRDLSKRAPSPNNPSPFNGLQAAAFAFADESTWHSKVSQKVYSDLKQELAKQLPQGITVEQQLVEAAVTCGTYNMVSRFLLATDVEQHAEVVVPYPSGECLSRTIFIENGVTLNTYVIQHEEKGAKPWIVLVNSLMTDFTMWEGVIARLSVNYNILAYDQRGHGKSSVPPAPCTLDQLADDIAKLLYQLRIPTPIKAVIGISQGGATTLNFAIRHNDKFEKLVVCDTQVKSPAANAAAWDQRIELARSKGMSALADATLPRWFPPESQLVSGSQEHIVRPMIESTKVEGFVAGARALQGYDLSDGIAAALKGKKTLFIAGEKDGKLPETLEATRKELASDGIDVSMHIVPGAGHLPVFLDNGLQSFLEKVEAFLAD